MNPEAQRKVDRIYVRANTNELTLRELTKEAIQMTLEDCHENKSHAAEHLDISRNKLTAVLNGKW